MAPNAVPPVDDTLPPIASLGSANHRARVVVGLAGGGMKWSIHGGAWAAMREMDIDVVEVHGISAGALVTAMWVQGRFDECVDLAHTVMTADAHRWKTGWEIFREYATGDLVALGRNDRLWSNYLSKLIPDDIGRIESPRGFVGTVDWETEKYMSVPHNAPNWARAVWGSATMPPPIWEPIEWEGHELVEGGHAHHWLVDGGVRRTLPLHDIFKRIREGLLYVDAIVLVSTGTGGLDYQPYARDIKKDSLRSMEILSGEVSRANLDWPLEINWILQQDEATRAGLRRRIIEIVQHRPEVEELMKGLLHELGAGAKYSRSGHRYMYVPIYVVRMVVSQGETLESSKLLQAQRFKAGYDRTRAVLMEGSVA